MKWMLSFLLVLTLAVSAAPDSLSSLRRQVAEQERQIEQLEVENTRLRYMLTEAEYLSDDPLYGIDTSKRVGDSEKVKPTLEEGYVVMKGDTLSEIAAAKGVELKSLAALNEISDPSSIRPGQRLRLPGKLEKVGPQLEFKQEPLASRKHTVASGENFYRISLRYGVNLEALFAENPSVDPHKLRIGQQIRIPQTEPMLAGGG